MRHIHKAVRITGIIADVDKLLRLETVRRP